MKILSILYFAESSLQKVIANITFAAAPERDEISQNRYFTKKTAKHKNTLKPKTYN